MMTLIQALAFGIAFSSSSWSAEAPDQALQGAMKSRLARIVEIEKDLKDGKQCSDRKIKCVQDLIVGEPIKFSLDLSKIPNLIIVYANDLKSRPECNAHCKNDLNLAFVESTLNYLSKFKVEELFAYRSLPKTHPDTPTFQIIEDVSSFKLWIACLC